MDFIDLIKERESIRDYDPEQFVSEEKLIRILEAGRYAPSASNRQPWRFLMISEPELLRKVKMSYKRPWFQNANHILVVIGNKINSWKKPSNDFDAVVTDCAIAMDHMILAAESMNIATCWICAFEKDILHDTLNIKSPEQVYSITPLGYPIAGFTKKKEKIRKPADEVYRMI